MEPKLTDKKQTQQRTNRRSYYCVARWCNNHNSNSLAMFRLPKGPRGKEWLRNAEREDLLDLDEAKLHRKYMCNKHFAPECFLKSNLLTWNAVPTLFTTFSKLPVSAKHVSSMNIPLAPKYFIIKENGSIESQNAVLTSISVARNGSEGPKYSNSGGKSSFKSVKSGVVPGCLKPQTSQKPNTTCPDMNESDQMVFLEEFSLMKQEPVLSCGTCGEIFLVESGLTQHRLRYHSDTTTKDVH